MIGPTKIILILSLGIAILAECYLLATQCKLSRTVNIVRENSCKNDNISVPVDGCYLDVALNVKITSPGEFLFITNKIGNPVLTAINIIICGLALNLLLHFKGHDFQAKELMGLKTILILIALKLFIESWMGVYMQNWFSGNSLLNTKGYTLNSDYPNMYICLFWLLIVGILIKYVNERINQREQQKNEIQAYQ